MHYSADQDGIRASMHAVEALADITIDDVNYKSCLSHNLRRLLQEMGQFSALDSNTADNVKSMQSYSSSLNYNGEFMYPSSPANAPPMMMESDNNNLSLSTHMLQGDSYHGGPMSYCATMPASPPAVYAVFNSNNLELMNNGMAMQHTVPVFTSSSSPTSPSDNNSYMSSPLQQQVVEVGMGVTGERGYFNTYMDYGYSSPYPHWGTPSPVTLARDIIVEGICHMLTPTSNYYPSPVMDGRHPLSFPQSMNAGAQVMYGGPAGYNTNYNRLTTPEASFGNSSMNPGPTPSGSARSITKSSRSIINSLRRSKQRTEDMMNVKKDFAP